MAKLLSRQSLNNGLRLELWDKSRHVAGDRWQVALQARIAIPVTAVTLPPELKPRLDEVTAALGPEVIFTQQKVRNFVDAREMAGLLKEMESRFLATVANYLGHPDFPGRFLRRKFEEHQQQQTWY